MCHHPGHPSTLGAVTMKPSASVDPGATRRLFSVLTAIWDTDRWRLELWDGSSAGESETPEFVLRFRSRRALDRLLGDLPDRGFGRAYVEGSLEVESLQAFLGRVNDLSMSRMARLLPRMLTTALALGARPDPRRIRVEARPRGRTAAPATARPSATITTSLPSSTGSSWAGP